MRPDDVCDLVLDACDLLERAARGASDDGLLAAEAELLRADLCAALGGCEDAAVAADGHAAITDLTALLTRLEARSERPFALSA